MVDVRKLKDEAATAKDKGRHRRAAELYEQLGRIEREDPQWPHRAGESWKRAGEKKSAIDQLTIAAELYGRSGFFLKAISVAKMVLEIDPEHTGTQEMLAALYSRRDERNPGGKPAEPAPPRAPLLPPLPPRTVEVSTPRPGAPIALEVEKAPEPAPGPRPASAIRGARPAPPPIELQEEELDLLPPSPRSPPPTPPPTPPDMAPPLHHMDVALEAPVLVDLDQPRTSLPPRPAAPPPTPRASVPPPPPGRPRTSVPPPPPPTPALKLQSLDGIEELDIDQIAVMEVPLTERIPGSHISQEFSIGAYNIPLGDPPPPPEPPLPSLPQIPLLSSLDEERLRKLITAARIVRCQPGDAVVRQGDRGDALYVVISGTMVVTVEGTPDPVARLGEGEFFGELALLTSEPRQATVVAETEAEVLEIARTAVWDLIEDQPDVLQTLLRFFRDRLLGKLRTTSELFASFTDDEARDLTERFQFLELRPKTELVNEGKRAEGLFVILLGRCEVRAGGDPGEVIATLGPGELAGEISLLTRGPAMATVVTLGPVWALAMPRAMFQEVILTHPQVLIYVNDVADQRRELVSRRVRMV